MLVAAALAGGPPSTAGHGGLGVETLGFGANLDANVFPLGPVACGGAGQGVGNFMKQGVAHSSLAVGDHKKRGEFDAAIIEMTDAQGPATSIESK